MYQSVFSVPKKDITIFIVMSIIVEVLCTIGEIVDVFCGFVHTHTHKKGVSAKEKIVDYVIKMMAEGLVLPWKSGLIKGVGFPVNYITRRAYHGANAFATYLHANVLARKGYKVTGEYITLKKCSELGGHVKKGEHGCVVIFPIRWNDTQKRAWKPEDNGSGDKWHLFFKFYYVFEVSQTTLEPKRKGTEKKNPNIPSIEDFVAKFFEKTGLKREYNVGTAFYAPLRHTVSVAEKQFYTSSEEYYSTIFHEMVHSTGKSMHRSSNTNFGSHEYSEEEIVAETGAMLLCMHFGIENVTKDNSVAYLQSWSKHLKDNPDWLVKGASQAEKAVAFMLKTVGLDASEFEYQSADTKDSEKASA